MSKGTKSSAGRPPRRDRLLGDEHPDPYRASEKLANLTSCPDCAACFREGRWTWRSAPADAPQSRCPACRRIQDDYPGGYLSIEGPFVSDHEEEILALVHNVEKRERAEHPLQRLMAITAQEGGVLVTTTDPHLAHGIGNALRHAYHGELEAKWADGGRLLRATWRR
jgi:hypothetical protein